ncbi:uncharacterized protein LOC118436338 [Folsomia candida]|nr:uncharacterized protein LOC118436338 [Folsomia candida]
MKCILLFEVFILLTFVIRGSKSRGPDKYGFRSSRHRPPPPNRSSSRPTPSRHPSKPSQHYNQYSGSQSNNDENQYYQHGHRRKFREDKPLLDHGDDDELNSGQVYLTTGTRSNSYYNTRRHQSPRENQRLHRIGYSERGTKLAHKNSHSERKRYDDDFNSWNQQYHGYPYIDENEEYHQIPPRKKNWTQQFDEYAAVDITNVPPPTITPDREPFDVSDIKVSTSILRIEYMISFAFLGLMYGLGFLVLFQSLCVPTAKIAVYLVYYALVRTGRVRPYTIQDALEQVPPQK